MATAVKRCFSTSAFGRGVLVAATATPGTTIHTSVASTTSGTYDEVWIYAMNNDVADRTVTIEWGAATTPNDVITATVSTKAGLFLIVPGLIMQNTQWIRAIASSVNSISIHGWVNSITD